MRATYLRGVEPHAGSNRVKGGERWWSSRRVNGWASIGGLGGGAWRHGPWVPPGAFRVASGCDWTAP